MNDSDQNDFLELESESLYLEDMHIGESEVVYHDLLEEDDFLIVGDPSYPDDPEAWCVLVLKGDYKDWVVRFTFVEFDKGELEFTYEVVYLPDGSTFDELETANFMSSLITEVIETLHGTDGQVYVDTETGEQVLDK
jgi:hypothetical protein